LASTNQRRLRRSVPIIAGVGALVLVLFAGACYWIAEWRNDARDSRWQMSSANNLKQIGLAIHDYQEIHGELPNNSHDPNGKPLLSWRVHLLPYDEHDNLYRQFKLDEPWDSPNNLALLNRGPIPFARPGEAWVGSLTYYRGFSSSGAVFECRTN